MNNNWPTIKFKFKENIIVILAPHMDDEVIGCGGVISRLVNQNKDVYIVFITDGTKGTIGNKLDSRLLQTRNEEAKRVITPNAEDAVGINPKVAERLSGADFDGDTVMVIPLSGRANITSTPELPGLEGFDPKDNYSYTDSRRDENGKLHYYRNGREFKVMSEDEKQQTKDRSMNRRR